ncbi:MAG: hypothetical protein ABI629_22560 [bacterium]
MKTIELPLRDTHDPEATRRILHSPRGLFLISQGIGILRKQAQAEGGANTLPPDKEIIARLFPPGSSRMVLDDATSTLIAAALLWGSRVLAKEDDPPRDDDVADMRRLLMLFRSHLPESLLTTSDLPLDD